MQTLKTPMTQMQSETDLRQDFINAMRNVASSVTVVTTNGPAGMLGATATAFNSVSADPPIVMVCLKKGSRIETAVTENQMLTINVLSQSDRYVAERFAGMHDSQIGDRFEGMEWTIEEGVSPIINRATTFCCDVFDSKIVASHRVIFGLVNKVICGSEKPLSYHHGQYCRTISLPNIS